MSSNLTAEQRQWSDGVKEFNPEPWKGYKPPEGYNITEAGVAFIKREKAKKEGEPETEYPELISGPIWITALTKDLTGANWGAVVNWLDKDWQKHEEAIPSSRFHEQGNGLAQYFADCGLYITPGKEQQLARYLARFLPETRSQSVDRLGWLSGDAPAYVLPKSTIGADRVVFQPERFSPTSSTMIQSGDLDDWIQNVFEPIKSEEILLFCAFASLSAPLLKFGQVESGGFHFHEDTSRGKTTALQVAASVWGCGKDPAIDSEHSFIRKWNTTQNALEGLAAAHNDCVLALDEIGTCDAKDFGKLIYDLFGGTGKSAMDQRRNLKKQRTWRTLVMSTGEVSVKTRLEKGGGQIKGGQLVRFCDIPTNGSVIRYSDNPSKFADEVKDVCGRFYGTAGPQFIAKLIEEHKTVKTFTETMRRMTDTALARLLKDKKVSPEIARISKRFALVETAGLLASELLGLSVTADHVQAVVSSVFEAWFEQAMKTLSDADRGVASIRDYILTNQARFARKMADGSADVSRISNLAGYHEPEKFYLLTEPAFREACAGVAPATVARALRAAELLHVQESDRNTSKHMVNGHTVSFYAVKEAVIAHEQ